MAIFAIMNEQQYPTLCFFGKEYFTPLLFADNTFVFNWELTPGHAVIEHIHPDVEEVFEITAGEVTFKIQGNTMLAKKGETIRIAKGIPHEIKNISKENATCKVLYYPAGDQGKFFDIGLFILKEKPKANGSAAMVFKMMFVSKQMNYKEFSTPPNAAGKLFFAALWAPIKLYGTLTGWSKITQRYKIYKTNAVPQ